MFRFEHPEYLWAYAVLPLVILLYGVYHFFRRRSRRAFASEHAMHRLLDEWSARLEWLKYSLLLVALALLCMSLANPQWGLRKEKVQAKSADVFIAFDISNSMLAQDIPPSRLERAKRLTAEIIDAFRGERIGLILFAGHAYLQMPLTTDYASAHLFLRSAHPRLATTQGTAIGDAIELASRAYEENDGHHKALIIITDGENHETGAIEEMERAKDQGVMTFIIAIGTTEGALIPIEIQGREDYKRDENGNPVRTSIDEAFLKALAKAGDGNLYHIDDGASMIEDMQSRIDQLERREMEQRAFKDYESYYQYFLFPAILLMLMEILISNRRALSREP